MTHKIQLSSIDHLVLTVSDLEASLHFYADILGMEPLTFGSGRRAVRFGAQKINFHERGREICPHAAAPQCGSADLCLITEMPLESVERILEENGVPVLLSRVERTGAAGRLLSTYVRDPDGNLIEIANRLEP